MFCKVTGCVRLLSCLGGLSSDPLVAFDRAASAGAPALATCDNFDLTAGDLAGRKRIFLLGLIVFTSASLLCALAPSMWVLIVLRLVQNGSVKTYAASMFVGVVAVLAYYLWR